MSNLKANTTLQNVIEKSLENGNEVFIDTTSGFLEEDKIYSFAKSQFFELAIQKVIKGRALVQLSKYEKETLLKLNVNNHLFDEKVLSIIEKEFLIGKTEKVKNTYIPSDLPWGMDIRFTEADIRR